jgi:2'-5' RNA ligase
MAFLGIKIPHETARLLGQIAIEGTPESPATFHITLLYLGKEVPVEDLAKCIEATFAVTSVTKPFTAQTTLVTSFPANPDDGIPIICRVESEPLHALQAALVASFKEHGVPFSDKYPEYKPHITLGYLPEGAPPDQTIPAVEWGVGEVVLWGGDSGDDVLVVQFPFSLASGREAAYRALVRLAALKTSHYDENFRADAKTIEECAEVARLLGDGRGAGFLLDMAQKLERDRDWLLSPKQTQYLDALRAKYVPKLPSLPKLRQKKQEQLAADAKLREDAEKAQAAILHEMESLVQDAKREGWRQEQLASDMRAFHYEKDPPYDAGVTMWNYDKDLLTVRIQVSKDGKSCFYHEHKVQIPSNEDPIAKGHKKVEAIERAMKVALGAIEKDKRVRQASTGWVEHRQRLTDRDPRGEGWSETTYVKHEGPYTITVVDRYAPRRSGTGWKIEEGDTLIERSRRLLQAGEPEQAQRAALEALVRIQQTKAAHQRTVARFLGVK